MGVVRIFIFRPVVSGDKVLFDSGHQGTCVHGVSHPSTHHEVKEPAVTGSSAQCSLSTSSHEALMWKNVHQRWQSSVTH